MIGPYAVKRTIKNSLVKEETIKWSFFHNASDLITCVVSEEKYINSLVVEVEDDTVKLSCSHVSYYTTNLLTLPEKEIRSLTTSQLVQVIYYIALRKM